LAGKRRAIPANLIWRSQAREDLLLIYEFVGLDNSAAAERLFTSIEEKTNLLVNHPRMGPRRPDIRTTVRILLEGPYLILYETHPDTDDGLITEVEIVRVLDGRRDLTRAF
jgi:toxin ParE1/3/4